DVCSSDLPRVARAAVDGADEAGGGEGAEALVGLANLIEGQFAGSTCVARVARAQHEFEAGAHGAGGEAEGGEAARQGSRRAAPTAAVGGAGSAAGRLRCGHHTSRDSMR